MNSKNNIENIHPYLILKFDTLIALLQQLQTLCATHKLEICEDETMAAALAARIDVIVALAQKCATLIGSATSLRIDYNLQSVPILHNYYHYSGCKSMEAQANSEYQNLLIRNNYVNNLLTIIYSAKGIVNTLLMGVNKLPLELKNKIVMSARDMNKNIGALENIELNLSNMSDGDSNVCQCGAAYIFNSETGEIQCQVCHQIKDQCDSMSANTCVAQQRWLGSVNEYEKYKRHKKNWIERIQAIEKYEFKDADLAKIEAMIKKNKIGIGALTCKSVRQILKELKLTALNNHIPLLMKTLGVQAPPLLTREERELLDRRFDRAAELYVQVHPESANNPYYPYFIYKILEEMFKGDNVKLRILKYIHLQSIETVIKNDKYYEQICKLAGPDDGLVYRPTSNVQFY